jgi:hypothetical protein
MRLIIYYYYVVAYFANVAPWDNAILCFSENAGKAFSPGYNNCYNTAVTDINLNVTYKAKPSSVRQVDNFFVPQILKPIHTLSPFFAG